jgi:hypothetical protein
MGVAVIKKATNAINLWRRQTPAKQRVTDAFKKIASIHETQILLHDRICGSCLWFGEDELARARGAAMRSVSSRACSDAGRNQQEIMEYNPNTRRSAPVSRIFSAAPLIYSDVAHS